MTNAHILLADNDPLLVQLLEQELEGNGYRITTVNNGMNCLRAVQELQPDLAILNWTLPDFSGLDICRCLRSVGNSSAIILLNDEDSIRDRVQGLDAGADDYLVKPFWLEEFFARIRARLRRVRQSQKWEILQFQDLSLNPNTREVYRGDRVLELTAKEFDLLNYLMTHPRQVLSREQILNAVWNDEFEGTSNIVEVYIRYLRRKLEAQCEDRLIHTIHCVGYVLREDCRQTLAKSA